MTDNTHEYQILPFSAERQVNVDAGRLANRRHIINGLLEIDVTLARGFIRKHKKKTGQTLSFTAFLITCFAGAIEKYPQVQAYRNWRNQLIVFNDVDVVTLIETEKDGVALPHIIRAANRKTFRQIHDEIRAVQSNANKSAQKRTARSAARASRLIRSLFFWYLRQNPHGLKRYSGTAVITAVGMFGEGAAWGLAFLPLHTVGLTVGSIAKKPGFVGNKIKPREYLSLTISFDHDIVDGAPAARFAESLKELIESGYGLLGVNQ